jgi:enoyl-CoA hydratase
MFAVERDHGVATVWLDRPDRLNAMGRAFWDDLPRVMAEVGDDDGVRAIVIAGRGRAFSVGLDLVEFAPEMAAGLLGEGTGSAAVQARARLEQIKLMQVAISAVADCPKPVIACVHGYCIGGGVDLITAADIRIAAADATFSVRETKMAMVADVGTLQRLPKIVDPGWVAELAYTGRDVDATEALTMGLVTHVHPDAAAAYQAAVALGGQIAANSPLAVQGAKAVLRATARFSVEEALDYGAVWNAAFLASSDLEEALRSFVEKREPDFTGE